MQNLISLKSLIVIFITIFFSLFYSCSANLNNDISTLDEYYFKQDSVKTTPLKITFNWNPKENDRINVNVSGDICSPIKYSSGWMSDSLITIEIDTGTENLIILECLYQLSSFYPYDVNYTVSIDDKYIVNESYELYKKPASPFTIHRFSSYLPLFRSSGVLKLGSTQFICPENPLSQVYYRPDCFDSLLFESSFDIREQFTLSIESHKNNVIFYDRLMRRGMGKTIEARLNEFNKYMILLREPENEIVNDTITVNYSCSKFSTNFDFIIQNECQPLIKPNQFLVTFNKRGAVGDTIIATPSFINENGEREFFSEETEFDVAIKNNCEYADILGPEGETAKIFGEMRQPIKILILGKPDNGKFGMFVGIVPNNKYGAYLKY